MEKADDIFTQVLTKPNEAGALQQVVLIGSWALPIYRTYFDNDPQIPILRTTDVDFLVSQVPRGEPKVDIQTILETMGFETQRSSVDGYCKHVHPEIEVEFLMPELGRGRDRPIYVEQFGVTALPLRYVSFAVDHTMTVAYGKLHVRVPKPEAFIILKLLILPRRKDETKLRKDIATIEALGDFLLHRTDSRARLASLYRGLPEFAELLQESRP